MGASFELRATARELARHFKPLQLSPGAAGRWPEAQPGDAVLMLSRDGAGYLGSRARWGLVGAFLDRLPPQPLSSLHSEGLEATPFYGKILRQNRCLIPATAFFAPLPVAGGRRQKLRIGPAGAKPMWFAGVFDRHRLAGTTCAILTLAAGPGFAPGLARLPVVLNEAEGAFWLAEHEEFPSAAYAEIVQPESRPLLVSELLAEPEPSPQLAFAFA